MTFRFRLIITIALLIALTFGIGGTALIFASFNATLEEEITSALDSFETAQNTLVLLNSFSETTDVHGFSEPLSQMEAQGMADWQAVTLKKGGETLYQSGAELLVGYTLPLPPANKCTYAKASDRYGQGLIVFSRLTVGEETLALEARFDLSPVYAARARQQQLFWLIYAAVVAIGALTATALSFAMTEKLKKLTVTVRRLAGGDLSTRSNLRSHDEFGQLSRDFDAMADKLQENITRLESQMQRQEAFMGAFAHELKTPMTSIIGYADLLRQDGLDDSTRLIAADYIFSEGQRLEKLSFKLLDLLLLKKDAPAMKTVNLNAFLQEVQKALSPMLEKKSIRFICKGERVKVVLEPDLVKSLLYNLVDNASKAIDGEGMIAVKGSRIEGGVCFQVADNGRGMKREELSKITEAFYRVDKARSRSQGGAGLGLALCKEIASLHQGSISFDSEEGSGTIVTVTLYGKENKNADPEI